MVPIPEQQAPLAQMRVLRDAGLPLRAVADQITAEDIKISHIGSKNALIPVDQNPPGRQTVMRRSSMRKAPEMDYRAAFPPARRSADRLIRGQGWRISSPAMMAARVLVPRTWVHSPSRYP
jgi:hypothetical protein